MLYLAAIGNNLSGLLPSLVMELMMGTCPAQSNDSSVLIIAGGLELPEPFKIDPVSLVHWILYLGAEKIDDFNIGENP